MHTFENQVKIICKIAKMGILNCRIVELLWWSAIWLCCQQTRPDRSTIWIGWSNMISDPIVWLPLSNISLLCYRWHDVCIQLSKCIHISMNKCYTDRWTRRESVHMSEYTLDLYKSVVEVFYICLEVIKMGICRGKKYIQWL